MVGATLAALCGASVQSVQMHSLSLSLSLSLLSCLQSLMNCLSVALTSGVTLNKQEAQLMLTNPSDAFRGQTTSSNIVPFDMLCMVSY